MIDRFMNYLVPLTAFIDNVFVNDVNLLGSYYPDYYKLGRGYGNLLSFGVFDLDSRGSSKLLSRGRVADGSSEVQGVDLNPIVEQTQHSWYENSTLNPAVGLTQPQADKAGAYSWLKAPRYGGAAYETGPLARMWVSGEYRRGISVMDRHHARALEASKIVHAMVGWLGQINLSAPFYSRYTAPAAGAAAGLTEAPRGALGHWVSINNQKISSYQVLTPTCWNCSPRDDNDQPGPLEKALEGTPVSNETMPIEALRVVHSYDPCLACAVH
jgi:hydrogenase large subunit